MIFTRIGSDEQRKINLGWLRREGIDKQDGQTTIYNCDTRSLDDKQNRRSGRKHVNQFPFSLP